MASGDAHSAILDILHEGVYAVDQDRRVTYWNPSSERITGFRREDAVGRCCRDNLLVHVNDEGVPLCDGFCPLKQTMSDGRTRETEMYLRHQEGHRIPVHTTVTPIRDESGNVTGAIQAFSERVSRPVVDDPVGELEEAALADDLTGLANRRMIRSAIETKFAEMNRYRWRFGALFLDIDHFKAVNDAHGHETGDEVLKVVANTLLSNVRPFDVAGRWGGEEFLILVANVSEEQLYRIADRFRVLVGQSAVPIGGDHVHVTVSVGATIATTQDDPRTLIQRADQLMYESKKAGRNRVSTSRAA